MRSPYMDILEKVTTQPTIFVLPSAYDAGIAASCLKSLARNRSITDVNIRQMWNKLIIWRGQLQEIVFAPRPTVGRVTRCQVIQLFGERRA